MIVYSFDMGCPCEKNTCNFVSFAHYSAGYSINTFQVNLHLDSLRNVLVKPKNIKKPG